MLPTFRIVLLLALVWPILAHNFTNPVIYEDFPDNDIFLGPDNVYYYSASSFHYSPGAPILKSYDLINWELIGHSVPMLNFGSNYNMTDGYAYNGGIWASTLRHRQSNDMWYWVGCVNFWTTYVYTAPDVTGPWSESASFQPCFYDCGMLIDDDDTMYVAYGSNNVSVAQLASDGLSIVQTQQVFSYPSYCSGIEGNRMNKINGTYYILDDCPSESYTVIWKADSPFGPYTSKPLLHDVSAPVADGGTPDQGSLIEGQDGNWYFMSFTWAYPLGRMPILTPITWGSDGFPIFTPVDGSWPTTLPYPLPEKKISSWTGKDEFEGTSLGPDWEWNHNPDPDYYAVNNGVTLQTATVTTDLFQARNSLVHRFQGPLAVGTVELNFTNMAIGDTCGLAAFKDESAWIGIVRNSSGYTVTAVQGLQQNSSANWATQSDGSVVGTAAIDVDTVWFRISADMRAAGTQLANFSYSTDGRDFTQLGGSYTLANDWEYFMGYRYAIFNFATEALGGSIEVLSFNSEEGSLAT